MINVMYDDIKIVVNGVLLERDGAGNPIREPFMLDGVTMVPARVIGEILAGGSSWDANTRTLYLGPRDPNAEKPLRAIPLFNRPYLEVGSRGGFGATGNATANTIRLYGTSSTTSSGRRTWRNHVTYPLNGQANMFTATLNPPVGLREPELIYRILGDGELLYTSPIMTPVVAPMQVNVNISGYNQLRIETILYTSDWFDGYTALSHSNYRGIENATITTRDY
jgi:hypothetical protein